MASKLSRFIEHNGKGVLFTLLQYYGTGYTARKLGYKSEAGLRSQLKKEGLWRQE